MALATPEDLAGRLGIAELTAAQTTHATAVLELATALVLDAIQKNEDWLVEVDEVPALLWVVCVEVAVRAFVNPTGVRSEQDSLGVRSESRSWADTSTGLRLTDYEGRACRRAVYGSNSGSARLKSVVDLLGEYPDVATVVEAAGPDDIILI